MTLACRLCVDITSAILFGVSGRLQRRERPAPRQDVRFRSITCTSFSNSALVIAMPSRKSFSMS